ncbi:MAG: YgjP-like metallopeptidase domain-containing protein [Desulfobacterales bacterium]
MEAKTVELKSVGTIKMERSFRARHISVSVRPFKGVRVAVPRGVSFASAEMFAQSKAGWIKKHLDKMKQMERAAKVLAENHPIDRQAARRRLVDRLNYLAVKHGFQYNRVFIKNQKTRWGSCSGKNNINLNVNLVRLPDELIDYTILHELVHIRIKNHGQRFWDQLNRLQGDAKQLDQALNEYSFLLAVKLS